MPISLSEQEALIRSALQVQKNAYAPYSRFLVGSAALSASGRIFVGCNVENASYGLAICAERSALTAMVSAGERQLTAMCIVSAGGASPCGACRQFIHEFGAEAELVLVDSEELEILAAPGLEQQPGLEQSPPRRIVLARELLPDSFGPNNLS